MAVKTSWAAGDVLTAADLTDTFADKAPRVGGILQVISAESTTQTLTTSSTYATANLSASITPGKNSNKVLVVASIMLIASVASCDIGLRIVRGSTNIYTNAGAGVFLANNGGVITLSYLDSPSTTSATTYTIHFARTAGTGNAYAQVNSLPSEITLMEVGA